MTDTLLPAIEPGCIAIVGMAGRFPAARTPGELWKLLAAGREATQWLTDDELRAAGVPEADLADPNYVRAGLVLPDMESFDAEFFGFSKRDAAILDPQHRHFLECAWEALEDAGHPPEKFDGAIGVFGGCGMQAYLPYNLLTNPELKKSVGLFLLRHTGNDKDFLTTRVSYLLDLKGPSVGIQTACSTSLVAVHVAAQSLLSGECDMALAGAASIDLPHRQGYRYAEGEILSPDGHCRAFDENASGTLFGSGAAMVVLRRLEDAVRDRDNIYAVIRGSAVNNDGSQKAGYLAPSVDGQARAAVEALGIANVDPGSVSYIEAHGTGTPVGDPIEVAALTQAYGDGGRGLLRHRLAQDQHRPPRHGGRRRVADQGVAGAAQRADPGDAELHPPEQPLRPGQDAVPRRQRIAALEARGARRAAPPSTRWASAAPTPTSSSRSRRCCRCRHPRNPGRCSRCRPARPASLER
jgi:acyl transferase domain-containing protein